MPDLVGDRDVMVLANPKIARLPGRVIGLVAAAGLAAALSTAAALLVISTAIAHDLVKRGCARNVTGHQELIKARVGAWSNETRQLSRTRWASFLSPTYSCCILPAK